MKVSQKIVQEWKDREHLGMAYCELEELIDMALREARAEGMREAIELLETDEAAHTCRERDKTFKWWKVNHIGPSLMAARLWAEWLKTKLTGEEPTDG